MINPDTIEWTFKHSWNLADQHHTVFRNDELGVQLEKVSNKDKGYGVGKSKSYFFIDGDDREFLSIEDMVNAYEEKFKFSEDNPEYEVKYVKIITKRVKPKK